MVATIHEKIESTLNLSAFITTPSDFDAKRESLPMIVFLHGAGERGDEMRAQRMMRKAILSWEADLAEGCEYSVTMGGLYNCFVGNGKTNRTAALCRMLGYGQMYLGNNTRAREYFNRAQSLDPSPKIAFELELMD